MRAFESSNEIGSYGIRDSLIDRMLDLKCRVCGEAEVPTLVHVTHAKAGSTWVAHLLFRLFRSRCAPRNSIVAQGGRIADHAFEPGRIYSSLFLTRDELLSDGELSNAVRFVVIRDLRDTLISLYFSLKLSHPTGHELVETMRETLQRLPEEEGLLHLIENRLQRIAELQSSWMGHDDLILRYEDLITNPLPTLESALIDRLRLPLTKPALNRAIRRTHFQTVFKRKLGEEKVESHGRKGLPGDWRAHFTPEVRRQFVSKFGPALIATGYEQDDSWAGAAA